MMATTKTPTPTAIPIIAPVGRSGAVVWLQYEQSSRRIRGDIVNQRYEGRFVEIYGEVGL